ncbi:hypothetical protein VIBNISFn118_660078 [Vibrio nigripulchritudo SFn118]|nr:hypothetical protein VIBNISFn118_660078 [Vibrio nigripulchritudo SFn118]
MSVKYILSDKYLVSTKMHEVRMSHWIYTPFITEVASGEVLLCLEKSRWELYRCKESNGHIVLVLVRYPDRNKKYSVEIDPISRTVTADNAVFPISNIKNVLDTLI